MKKYIHSFSLFLLLFSSVNVSALDIDYSLLNKPAPAFEFAKLSDNEILKLSDYKGKLVLINFWASWCGPCRAEIPTLVKLQEEYQTQNFRVIGVAVESKADAQTFLKDKKLNYPNVYTEGKGIKELLKKYGNPDQVLPFSVLLSPKQEVMAIYPGILSKNKMQRVLSRLLGGI